MSLVVLYDHFIARGGAEFVSLRIRAHFKDCHIETAYADHTIFAEDIEKAHIKVSDFTPLNGPLNSLKLLLYYLFRYNLPESKSALVSGLFAPFCLLRRQKVRRKLIYFHMFPIFLDWTSADFRNRFGLIAALVGPLFVELYRCLLRAAVIKADVVFSNSLQAQSRFLKNGIVTKLLYPPVEIHDVGGETDSGFFLSTARLEESKRVRLIADVFTHLTEHQIVFVGGGTLLEEFECKYAEYPNIKFVGWVSPQDVSAYCRAAKALIYIPENEAFGIAPIEAFAAGKGVIGVAEAGLIETVDDARLGTLITLPITLDKLKDKVLEFSKRNDSEKTISYRKKYAQKFKSERFLTEIETELQEHDEEPPSL